MVAALDLTDRRVRSTPAFFNPWSGSNRGGSSGLIVALDSLGDHRGGVGDAARAPLLLSLDDPHPLALLRQLNAVPGTNIVQILEYLKANIKLS